MSDLPRSAPLRVPEVIGFMAVVALVWIALSTGSEYLVYRFGHDNPFFKIETSQNKDYDWLFLGTSHAMPLSFGGAQEQIEEASGQSIINLASPGAGPYYHRVVFDQFLTRHRARGLIYFVDSFAFFDAQWNEGRLGDPELLARTPYDTSLLTAMMRDLWRLGPVPVLSYATAFSKVNNLDRFETDIWSAADQFDRRFRPSQAAEAARIDYLFPHLRPGAETLDRYLGDLMAIIDRAAFEGMIVKVIKLPVPERFYARYPYEPEFDAGLSQALAERGLALEDYSLSLPDPRFYFDSDHLGREGVETFGQQTLVPLLRQLPAVSVAQDQGGSSPHTP